MPLVIEIGPMVLEKKVLKLIYVLLFRNYLPLVKGCDHLKKLEASSPPNNLCLVWLKSGEEGCLKFVNVFSLLRNCTVWLFI